MAHRMLHVLAALLCFGSPPVLADDHLELTLEVAEVFCGEQGRPMDVCDDLDVAFRSNLVGQGLNDLTREATSRFASRFPATAGQSVDQELEVLDGIMNATLDVSAVEDGRVTIDVQYRIEMSADRIQEGHTQVLSTLADEPLPIGGGSTTYTLDDQLQKVIRAIIVRAKRR